jgi:hypothetical protein
MIYRNSALSDSPIRKYFITALTIKFFGALSSGLIYEFYYGGGAWDTFNFHIMGSNIINCMLDDFEIGWKLLMLDAGEYDPELMPYIGNFYSFYFKEDSAFFISKLSAVIGLFTFNSYTTIACTFGAFSFIGNWCIFTVFYKEYPQYINSLAAPILYIPSVIFWGSGLFKDSIVFGCLGIIIYALYTIVVEGKDYLKNILIIIIFIFIAYRVKDYVALAIFPAAFMIILQKYKSRIKNRFFRSLIAPTVLGLTFYFSVDIITSNTFGENISIDQTINTIQNMQQWHTQVSSIETSYNLGDYEPSILGVIQKAIPAINVTFFRPYIWEASGFLMIIAALESHVIFILFILTILSSSPKRLLNLIRNEPLITFSLIFSLVLGFIVGFTSYNFGALVRYKIPILPLFISSILLLRKISNENKHIYSSRKSKADLNKLK